MALAARLSDPASHASLTRVVTHCSARPNLKKTHIILDLRIALYSELMPYSTLLMEVLDTYEGERLGKKAPGGLARKARGKA